MFLLYSDESGSVKDAGTRYFVLAGFAMFERQGYWISSELDAIAARFNPDDPASVELHGSPMLAGRGMWRRIPRVERETAIIDALGVFSRTHHSNRLFASVVRKDSTAVTDIIGTTFEQIATRFDYCLQRLHRQGDTQRGLIIFDKTTYESTIQGMATDFRTIGHQWGVLRNFSEVPLFLDSRASRLIQLADLLAYAIFRHYEKGDSRFYSIIRNKFDSEGGVVHGLHEIL